MRLAPVLEFAEVTKNRQRWPLAADVDHYFATEFRAMLFQRQITGNGHPLALPKVVSEGQRVNVLGCCATLFNWATKPGIHLLPADFLNPFTPDLVGRRPRRDPLAPSKLPLDLRIEIVGAMDAWQLAVLAISFILPCRPEEVAGLLVTDVDRAQRTLVFGTRFGGSDFTKSRLSFRLPYPAQFDPIITWLTRGRSDGPLLLRRSAREKLLSAPQTSKSVDSDFKIALEKAKKGSIQAPHDQKALFRNVMRQHGGLTRDTLAAEFRKVLAAVRPGLRSRFYDLRGAVSTDLEDAGVDIIVRRYVTGHSLGREILAAYEFQNVPLHMAKYFLYINDLLTAVQVRARALGMV